MRSDWTTEQISRAVLYGVCDECGEPRAYERTITVERDGHEHVLTKLVCTADRAHNPGGKR